MYLLCDITKKGFRSKRQNLNKKFQVVDSTSYADTNRSAYTIALGIGHKVTARVGWR
jgi:hypothetical protein